MPDASPEEVRAIFRPAYEKAVEIAAVSPRSRYEHIEARRAADAIDALARTLTGRPMSDPAGR